MSDNATTTAPTSAAAGGGDLGGALSHFKAARANLTIELTGMLGVDMSARIRYQGDSQDFGGGKFFVQTSVIGGPSGTEREMTDGERQAVLASLKQEMQHPNPQVHGSVLRLFVDHLGASLRHKAPPGRFDHVRFGDITRDPAGGLIAHLGIGIDMVGTVHADPQGNLTYEQHVVPMRPGTPAPLSSADRASLTANLQRYVASSGGQSNPLWQELLNDAKK